MRMRNDQFAATLSARLLGARLRDLGEGKLVRELIQPRFPSSEAQVVGIGDDCAVLQPLLPDHAFVVTTDPCPLPVVCVLEQPDYYHYGWLTSVINVSDLAAMGARPVGMVVSLVMREDMALSDFERYLDGLADAATAWRCPVVGGNVKDGTDFHATATAFGSIDVRHLMRRDGARPGDAVVVIGDMGRFWSAVLLRLTPMALVHRTHRSDVECALYSPVPRVTVGCALAPTGFITSCIDASDGVSDSLFKLAAASGVDIIVENETLIPKASVQAVASAIRLDPRKLMLTWGDWQLVATVRPSSIDAVRRIATSLGDPVHVIGHVERGGGDVRLRDGTKEGTLTNFTSERFTPASIFTHGLGAFRDLLIDSPLTCAG